MRYKLKIKQHNEAIKLAVERGWRYNKEIIYKTPDEVLELKKTNPTKYVVLRYSEDLDLVGDKFDSHGIASGPLLCAECASPAIKISRLEKNVADYYFILPERVDFTPKERLRTTMSTVDFFRSPDLMVSFYIMQDYFDAVKMSNKKMKYSDYMLSIEQNIDKLKSKKILINKDFLYKDWPPSVTKKKGNVEVVNEVTILDAIINETDIVVSYQFRTKKGKARQCLINAKTGYVYQLNEDGW